MSTTTVEPKLSAPKPTKSTMEKAQGYMVLASTTFGVIGALGTAFVWIATNICVGDVEIRTDKPVENLVTKVTDKRGQTTTVYGKHVQVMPGNYHLEIGLPDKPLKHVDATVAMWKSQAISVNVPAELAIAEPNSKAGRKRWWQFWKKSADDTKSNGESADSDE